MIGATFFCVVNLVNGENASRFIKLGKRQTNNWMFHICSEDYSTTKGCLSTYWRTKKEWPYIWLSLPLSKMSQKLESTVNIMQKLSEGSPQWHLKISK